MSLQTPKFGTVDVEANREVTRSSSLFVDIKPDSKIRVRFLPPSIGPERTMLFFKAVNHYKYKDGDDKRAWACLSTHGTDDLGACACCDLSNAMKKIPATKKLGKDIEARGRWYAQVIVQGQEVDGIRLLALSKTTAEQVTDILSMQASDDEPFFCDADEGIWIQIAREGAQLETKYTVLPTSKRVTLESLVPTWEADALDVPDAVGLYIGSRQEQLASIIETYRLKFSGLFEDIFTADELIEAATE